MSAQLIVLVDDDRAWSTGTAALLQEEGFEVQTAADGERGLELILESQPCMVILDAHLPRVGGLEVLGELRRSQMHMPVLMVSGDDRSALINQAMEEGATGFLRKPVPGPLLVHAIRRSLERHAKARETMARSS
jgi:DNA-binding response OmpR family regulator